MAFRGQNRNRNYGGGNYGGMNRGGMNPWDNQGGNYGGGMRQGGGQGMNAEALNLANNLLNNLLRNPNQNPPSLLNMNRGGGMNRNRQMGNRPGGVGGIGNGRNRRPGAINNNRGPKSGNKQASGGVRKQANLDRAKKLLAKHSNKKKDGSDDSERKSQYADVPNDMFYCHLCKKHMYDALSFENHIKGRTHLMMREGIEESYRLKANMIRQEAKIAETLKSIEYDRLKRMGKTPSKRGNPEYCTMCDLTFLGHLSTHRKSDGHLQLKKFLHPKCGECAKEFPTRIEYDSHLLSPDHLKRAAEKNLKIGERKLLQTLHILTEEEESRDVRPPQKRKKKVVKKEEEKKEGEEGDEKKENGEGEGEEEKKEEAAPEGDEEHENDETKEGDQTMEEGKEDEYEEVPLPIDPEDVILVFDENQDVPEEIDDKLPKYNWTRPVGANLIKRLECIECRLCGKFFDSENTAEIHTRTVTHHRAFLKFISEKSSDAKIAQKRAAAAAEEVERKKKKLEEAEAAAAAAAEGKAEGEETGELYDPSEATADDEDVDMAANGEQNGEGTEDANTSAQETVDEMETEQPVEEVKEEEPVVEEPEAPEPPVVTESPAPAATPAKKGAAAKTATPRATPQRNRGRGRYNRY